MTLKRNSRSKSKKKTPAISKTKRKKTVKKNAVKTRLVSKKKGPKKKKSVLTKKKPARKKSGKNPVKPAKKKSKPSRLKTQGNGASQGYLRPKLITSAATSNGNGNGHSFRREFERKRLPHLFLGSEQLKIPQFDKIFPLSDISIGGLGLRLVDVDDVECFAVGMKLQGVLNLQRKKLPVTFRVRHVNTHLVGVQFEELSVESQMAIEEFLSPTNLGRELKPFPSSEIRNTLWYHGPNQTELLLKRGNDGQFYRMVLSVLGNYIQWDAKEGLVTGVAQLSDPADLQGVLLFENHWINPDRSPDESKLSIAKTLILSSNLPQELKRWCVRHIYPKET